VSGLGRGPLLVTGMPRTATSWVGRMLEASGRLVYVHQPLNPNHPPGRSPGVLRAEVRHAFQYISEEDERGWLPAFRDTVRLRYHPLAELRRNHAPEDLRRAAGQMAGFALGRLRGRRALLADPYAVFAAPWLHRRVGCQVVVTVRDPVATVSRWRRLGWRPTLGELLAQPALVRDRLAPFRGELAAAGADPADVVGQATLLWRVIYGTVLAFRREIQGVVVVRAEDLAEDPAPAAAALYDRLGLPFGPAAERAIVRTSSRLTGAPPWGSPDPSGCESTGQDGLPLREAARVRELTADVAPAYGYVAERLRR
jgi:hypothetical protein